MDADLFTPIPRKTLLGVPCSALFGDCLDVMQGMDSETVDLIYIDPPVALNRLIRHSFPDYGVEVEATTIDGKTGVWSHGQYGWYPQRKWGIKEHSHDHIASWEPLPNRRDMQ